MIERLMTSFVNGLLVPLTAACVLPLYPAYLSYLSKEYDGTESRKNYILSGVLVFAGVISFMSLTGVIFTALLQKSLASVINVVSPIAFGVLAIFSLFLIFDYDFWSKFSRIEPPKTESPLLNAFGFGFFFGAIVIPCNPAFIAVFFARASLFASPVSNLLNFLAFGTGIGFPLLAFSVFSSGWSQRIINLLKNNQSKVNRSTGVLMLVISIYYLFFVFQII